MYGEEISSTELDKFEIELMPFPPNLKILVAEPDWLVDGFLFSVELMFS